MNGFSVWFLGDECTLAEGHPGHLTRIVVLDALGDVRASLPDDLGFEGVIVVITMINDAYRLGVKRGKDELRAEFRALLGGNL